LKFDLFLLVKIGVEDLFDTHPFLLSQFLESSDALRRQLLPFPRMFLFPLSDDDLSPSERCAMFEPTVLFATQKPVKTGQMPSSLGVSFVKTALFKLAINDSLEFLAEFRVINFVLEGAVITNTGAGEIADFHCRHNLEIR
jgi:hypothetical protein